MTYKAFPRPRSILRWSSSCPGVEMIIFFKKYINFILLTPKLPLFGVIDHEIYSSLSPYPINVTYKFGQD